MDAQIPKPGDVIAGRLLVERVIGRGGMGVVLAARHQELGERVAIKMLRLPAGDDVRAVERLRREARAAARLRGEHVVRIMDVGTTESGAPYLVMEYVAGQTIAQLREARGRVSVEEAVDLVLQACEGLAEAHGRGVVHRDIKPSNLLLSRRPDGSPLLKLLDFGIAKSFSVAASTLTETGGFLGSPLYASPEQARDARVVDQRTDIWSLGVVLYELLTGKLPFPSFTAAGVLASLLADPPVAPRAVAPELPVPLERVLLRCLEKEPNARYADIAELAFALEPFASDSAGGAAARVARILSQAGERLSDPPINPETDESTLGGSQDESLNASRTARISEAPADAVSPRRSRVAAALILAGVLLVFIGWISRPGARTGAPMERMASSRASAFALPSSALADALPQIPASALPVVVSTLAAPSSSASPRPVAPLTSSGVAQSEQRPKTRGAASAAVANGHNKPTGVLEGEEDFGPRN